MNNQKPGGDAIDAGWVFISGQWYCQKCADEKQFDLVKQTT